MTRRPPTDDAARLRLREALARGPLGAVPRLVLLHLGLSGVFITGFVLAFDYPLRVVPLHVASVGFWSALVALALGASIRIPGLRGSRGARAWFAAVPAAASGLLVTIDAGNVATNLAWGGNLTGAFLAGLGAQAEAVLASGSFLLGGSALAVLGSAALVAGILAAYWRYADRLMEGLVELFGAGRPFSLFRDGSRTLVSLASIAFGLLLFDAARDRTLEAKNAGIWEGEPIASLSLLSRVQMDAHRLDVARRDQRSRDAYPAAPPPHPRNVVLVMVDSLRADHMQVYGYPRETTPFLQELLESGRLRKVRLALSTCSESICGMLSTLASKEFRSLGYRNFKLHDLLSDCGFAVYFLEAGDPNWYDTKALYGSMDWFYDAGSSRFALHDDRVVLEGLEQLPDPEGRPVFLYLRLMSAHFVGKRFEGRGPFQPEIAWSAFAGATGERQRLVNTYDNGVWQTDAVLRRIFGALEARGTLRDAMVVILGDHGEPLGERGQVGHTSSLYQEDIRIPLLIYDDPRAAYGNLDFATQVDVAPTVVDRLGLPVPAVWQGRSLLDPDAKRFSFHQTHHPNPWRAVVFRTGRRTFKYLRREGRLGSEAREELYELERDARERRNLIAAVDPSLVRMLARQLAAAAGREPAAAVAR